MDVCIDIRGLRKVFKRKRKRGEEVPDSRERGRFVVALDDVSLSIGKGELFGLLGPNGAGKTTLVKCLSTLLLPDSGTACISGFDIVDDPISARKVLGLVTGGERTLYWKLSAYDNLKYFSALYGLAAREARDRIDYLLEVMGLTDRAHERLEKYSSGMRQKVSLARALLHDPSVLLLDEPTLGLDPSFAKYIRDFIKEELNRKMGKTILVTTHNMDEAEKLCERVAIINEGKIIKVDTPLALRRAIPFERVLEVKYQGEIYGDVFRGVRGVEKTTFVHQEGLGTIRIHSESVEDVVGNVIDLVRPHAKILAINICEPTLEDVFIHLTGAKLSQ